MERPRTSTFRYGTRGVNVAGNTSGRRQDEKMEEAEEARSSHEAKRYHWWNKCEEQEKPGWRTMTRIAQGTTSIRKWWSIDAHGKVPSNLDGHV